MVTLYTYKKETRRAPITHTARPKLRDVFHQLLFALACFDMTFIVCGGVNYTFRAFKVGLAGSIHQIEELRIM